LLAAETVWTQPDAGIALAVVAIAGVAIATRTRRRVGRQRRRLGLVGPIEAGTLLAEPGAWGLLAAAIARHWLASDSFIRVGCVSIIAGYSSTVGRRCIAGQPFCD